MAHTHDISCLEEKGGVLVCRVSGKSGRLPRPARYILFRWRGNVFSLTRPDLDEWKKWNYSAVPLESNRIGDKLYVEHYGEWFKHPYRPGSGSGAQAIPEQEVEKKIRWLPDFSKLDSHEIEFAVKRHWEGKTKNDMRHFGALQAMARNLGLPTAYANDLKVHDKNSLRARDPGLPFGWYLRESGTSLFFPEHASKENGKEQGFRHSINQIKGAFGAGHWFAWDGRNLTPMQPMQLADWLEMERDRILGRRR